MKTRLITLAALGVLLAAAALAADSPGYHVGKKLVVGGEGGWDYLTVDSAGRRLYVSLRGVGELRAA
jgi:hypothetical protein